jgi:hypothetical protein
MEITENFKKYLSGFFDGDGSITVEKMKAGYTLRIKFSQSNENWIDTIKNYYPFLKKSGYKRDDKNSRKEFELRASGIQIKPLVQDLLKYSILKYEQLIEASKFFELINTRNKNEEKEQIYLKLKELKNCDNNKPYERLSLCYIAGLFDAEGSIGIYNKTLRVKITQKSDIVILQKIGEMYGNVNNIDNYAISFYGKNSLNFLNDVKEYCIYKTPQILVALKYIDTINVELTDEIIRLREEYIKVLKDEKHV